MKKKIGFSILLGTFCVVAMFAQANPRPTTPQPMSSKTAMEYFRDEDIKIGINLGNTLDAVDTWTNRNNPISIETAWGNVRANQAHFDGVKAQGFDIIRIPVTWTGHIGPAPDYRLEEAWLRRVTEVVNMAHNAGLNAVINIHHDGHHDHGGWLLIDKALSNRRNNDQITDQFEKVWRQIAEYFVNYGDWLMFEGFNEIHTGDWGTGTSAQYRVINDWNQRFTNTVRATGGNNAQRYLIYNGYNTHHSIANSSSAFRLPQDSAANRQIVSFHYYEPNDFVLQVKNHIWPNSSHGGRRQDLTAIFGRMKTRFIDNNIPVIIGENGPFRYMNYKGNTGYKAANVEMARRNRLEYVDHLYTSARANGLVPFFWENGTLDNQYAVEGDGSLFDRNSGQPNLPENAEVIRRMMNAVNNTTPPAPLR